MTEQGLHNQDINGIIETLICFSKLLSDTEKLSNVQMAMKCAMNVERLFESLGQQQLDDLLVSRLCSALKVDEDSYDCSKYKYACDTLLEIILTCVETQPSDLLRCMSDYISFCGKDRFNQLISQMIVRSEVCRVLLDFIGTVVDNPEMKSMFEANVFLKTLPCGDNQPTLVQLVHTWLNSDHSSCIETAFKDISQKGVNHPTSQIIIQGFISIFDNQEESAVRLLDAIISSSTAMAVLKDSRNLLHAFLDFLSKIVENFQFSLDFYWVPQINGPCKVIQFETVIQSLNTLIRADDILASVVNVFLDEKCSLPGCAVWEDIRSSLD